MIKIDYYLVNKSLVLSVEWFNNRIVVTLISGASKSLVFLNRAEAKEIFESISII